MRLRTRKRGGGTSWVDEMSFRNVRGDTHNERDLVKIECMDADIMLTEAYACVDDDTRWIAEMVQWRAYGLRNSPFARFGIRVVLMASPFCGYDADTLVVKCVRYPRRSKWAIGADGGREHAERDFLRALCTMASNGPLVMMPFNICVSDIGFDRDVLLPCRHTWMQSMASALSTLRDRPWTTPDIERTNALARALARMCARRQRHDGHVVPHMGDGQHVDPIARVPSSIRPFRWIGPHARGRP